MPDKQIHTAKFHHRREVWHLGDLRLPRPFPVTPTAAALAILVIEWRIGLFGLVSHLAFPFSILPILVGPFVAYRLTDRPLVEGRPLHVFIASQLRFAFVEHRRYVGLTAVHEPRRARGRLGEIWSKE